MQNLKRDYKQICMGEMRMQFNLSEGELVTVEKCQTQLKHGGSAQWRLDIRIERDGFVGGCTQYAIDKFLVPQIIYGVTKAKARFKSQVAAAVLNKYRDEVYRVGSI